VREQLEELVSVWGFSVPAEQDHQIQPHCRIDHEKDDLYDGDGP
jgi:hypothetical protein